MENTVLCTLHVRHACTVIELFIPQRGQQPCLQAVHDSTVFLSPKAAACAAAGSAVLTPGQGYIVEVCGLAGGELERPLVHPLHGALVGGRVPLHRVAIDLQHNGCNGMKYANILQCNGAAC